MRITARNSKGLVVNPAERRAMWAGRETVEQVANMMVMDPYPGFAGKYFAMPAQRAPQASTKAPPRRFGWPVSNRSPLICRAAKDRALTFAFIDPAELGTG